MKSGGMKSDRNKRRQMTSNPLSRWIWLLWTLLIWTLLNPWQAIPIPIIPKPIFYSRNISIYQRPVLRVKSFLPSKFEYLTAILSRYIGIISGLHAILMFDLISMRKGEKWMCDWLYLKTNRIEMRLLWIKLVKDQLECFFFVDTIRYSELQKEIEAGAQVTKFTDISSGNNQRLVE